MLFVYYWIQLKHKEPRRLSLACAILAERVSIKVHQPLYSVHLAGNAVAAHCILLLVDGRNEILKPACQVQSTTSCVWHVPSSFVQFKLWKQLFDRLDLCNTQACGRTCTIVYDCTIVPWLFANICDLVQNKELVIVGPLFFDANQSNCELSCCNWTFLSQINFLDIIE